MLARSIFCYISLAKTDESKGPYVFYALGAFACAEPHRYPYYLLKVLGAENTNVGLFYGHLRFNLFMFFYPIGAFCDLMAGVMACDNMIKEGFGVYPLPNKYNVSFNWPFLMYYVVTTIYSFMLPFNYSYLLKQRSKYYATPFPVEEKKVEKKETKKNK